MSTETRQYTLKERARRQEQTRGRIVAAAEQLHQEVGPARTTVAEIARRAGVQRLTVYNHFPGDAELFEACSTNYMAEHPLPRLDDALALEGAGRRVETVLARLYGWYRETASMTANIQRDRLLVAAVDERAAVVFDAPMAELAGALAAGFGVEGPRLERVEALLGVGLDFWTWRRLTREGMSDDTAAALMASADASAAQP